MALSNSTLSGCWVSLVIGFSYFLCLNPHAPSASNATPSATRPHALFCQIVISTPYPTSYLDGERLLRRLPHSDESVPWIHSVKNRGTGHHPLYPSVNSIRYVIQRNPS